MKKKYRVLFKIGAMNLTAVLTINAESFDSENSTFINGTVDAQHEEEKLSSLFTDEPFEQLYLKPKNIYTITLIK